MSFGFCIKIAPMQFLCVGCGVNMFAPCLHNPSRIPFSDHRSRNDDLKRDQNPPYRQGGSGRCRRDTKKGRRHYACGPEVVGSKKTVLCQHLAAGLCKAIIKESVKKRKRLYKADGGVCGHSCRVYWQHSSKNAVLRFPFGVKYDAHNIMSSVFLQKKNKGQRISIHCLRLSVCEKMFLFQHGTEMLNLFENRSFLPENRFAP